MAKKAQKKVSDKIRFEDVIAKLRLPTAPGSFVLKNKKKYTRKKKHKKADY